MKGLTIALLITSLLVMGFIILDQPKEQCSKFVTKKQQFYNFKTNSYDEAEVKICTE